MCCGWLPVKLRTLTGRVSCKALWKWYLTLRQPGSRKAGGPQVQGAERKGGAGREKVAPEAPDCSWPSEIPQDFQCS